MMDALPLAYVVEPVPGLRNRIIHHTRKALAAKVRTRGGEQYVHITHDDLDGLSVEEVYGQCPVASTIERIPRDRDMRSMYEFQRTLDLVLTDKTMNEWAKSLITLVHTRKNPTKKWS